MKLEKKHIAFLQDILKISSNFEIKKPLNELIEKEPRFLADFVAAIYRRRPICYELKSLLRNYPFFKNRLEFNENTFALSDFEKKAKKIHNKHFPGDKGQNNSLDLMRRLNESKDCLLYNDKECECEGLPDANSGIGGCEGGVYCPICNLGGSHGSIGGYYKNLIFKETGKWYSHPAEVPKEIRLKIMRKLYKEHLSNFNKRENKSNLKKNK